MIDTSKHASKILGWGADLKPENRPGVPKEKAPPHGTGAHWKEPERQEPPFKIYKTVERSDLTPVFGTTCPPKGLSGKLRDLAYLLAEDRISRWVLLLFADRVDVVESIVSDVISGKAGNPITQTGIQIEFKEGGQFDQAQRRRLAIALGAGSVGFIASKLIKNRKRKPTSKRKKEIQRKTA